MTNLVKCYCPRCIVGAHDDTQLAAIYRLHAEWRERAEKAEAEVERLTEQLDATKKLCVKFWDILKENGFRLKINNEYYDLPEAK